jgi:hypothetical protein
MSSRHARAGLAVSLFLCGAALAQAQDAARYFPLAKGNKWVYASTTKRTAVSGKETFQLQDTSGTETREITGPTDRADDPAGVFIEKRLVQEKGKVNGSQGDSRLTASAYVGVIDGALSLYHQVTGGVAGEPADKQDYRPALAVVKSVKEGESWTVGTVRQQKLLMPAKAKVTGVEDVKVPAGEFKDCLKVLTEVTDPAGQIVMPDITLEVKKGKTTKTSWYAPGVGLVKEQTSSTLSLAGGSDMLELNQEKSLELTRDYKVAP